MKISAEYALKLCRKLSCLDGFPTEPSDIADVAESLTNWLHSTQDGDLFVHEALAGEKSWQEILESDLWIYEELCCPEPFFEFLPRQFLNSEDALLNRYGDLELEGCLMRTVSWCKQHGAIHADILADQARFASLLRIEPAVAERLLPKIRPYFETHPKDPKWLQFSSRVDFIGRMWTSASAGGWADPGPGEK